MVEKQKIKVLGICSSPVKRSNAEAFLKMALDAAAAMGDDVVTELVPLAGKEIKDCIHCHWCENKQVAGKPPCNIHDDMLEIWPKLFECDALLLATPVYIARMNGVMANFLDRVRALEHSNYYQGIMANKVGGALAVLWFRDAGGETALQTMLWGIMGAGMIVATGFGSAKFGAVGLTTIHGTGASDPDDPKDKHLVLKDKWGCRSARIIGRRAVFLARIMKPIVQAGQKVPGYGVSLANDKGTK